jgi:ribonuclease-3
LIEWEQKSEPELEEASLSQLEESLGYVFRDRTLLETALQHASYAHETKGTSSNERLEFLGDSVIGLAVAHLLYDAHPSWAEGNLTRALHTLVDREALAQLARDLEIGRFLRLGRTEQRSGGVAKDGILADAIEAVIGAMFLDGGLDPVTRLAGRVFESAMAVDAPPVERDPKTRFQEWVMAQFGQFPRYDCVGDTEIEGDEERFTVRVLVEGEDWGRGTARSKRRAERGAAERALERCRVAEEITSGERASAEGERCGD